MNKSIQTVQAILALAAKNINTPDAAINEKKIGSFPMYSQGIQAAVQEGYIRIVNSEPPKYFLSEHGLQFVHNILDFLEIPG